MPSLSDSQNFNDLVALFLAEAVRTRRASLTRAAEISQRVINHLGNIKSEDGALQMLTNLEKDFGEVGSLKQALHFGYKPSDVKIFEREIKEYASKIFVQDLHLSSHFLEDAARPEMTIQQLCIKYPQFCKFLLASPEKAELLPELGA